MRPWLLLSFGLLLPVACARFLSFDVIGGIFLILTAGIGWYAVKGAMDITWLLCLAVVLFLNSVFDAIILLARAVHTQAPLFGHQVPWWVNLKHGLLFLGPVFEMTGALMCWKIYREHLSNLAYEEGFMDLDQGYGAVDEQGPRGIQAGYGYGSGGRGPHGSSHMHQGNNAGVNFEAFQGRGHRISD